MLDGDKGDIHVVNVLYNQSQEDRVVTNFVHLKKGW